MVIWRALKICITTLLLSTVAILAMMFFLYITAPSEGRDRECCAAKGRDTACVPCRPTREIAP